MVVGNLGIFCSLLPGDTHHHHHQHQDHQQSDFQDHPHNNEARSGRALNNLLDFSSAKLDEATGLKCINTEAQIQSLERESLLRNH